VYGVAINSQVDIFWESIFTIVNAVQVVILIRERQRICLTDEEVSLREAVFPHMSRLDYHRVIRAGSWQSHAPGVELLLRGQPVDQIVLLSDGTADVIVDSAVIGQCRRGDFIGEIAFMTDNPATATVTTASPTRCLAWKFTDLRALLNHHPDLRTDLQTVFNKNLIGKLIEQRDRHAVK
jgi:CRP-like cAMP-binding protein